MDKFVIHGGTPLHGTVRISGAKNATIALMPATLLASGVSQLHNSPVLRDVTTMTRVLETIGEKIQRRDDALVIDSTDINNYEAPYEHVKKMRASIYVLGPLVARFGKAKVSLPGGCAWGPRPVNLHLEALQKLGADISLDAGYIIAKASRLKGTRISFDISSVGATINIMMAATLAQGVTEIHNAAIEPEVTAVTEYLTAMGAKIEGIGTQTLIIQGVDELHAADHTNIPDRIEAGTFLIAGAITGGEITITDCEPAHIDSLLEKLEDIGCEIKRSSASVTLRGPRELRSVDVNTAVYPGFPTDLQAQWIALMSVAGQTSVVTDTVYFDRFTHIPELNRLGANIEVTENVAVVRGVDHLRGAKVMSTDLRASASLILAGLAAEGETEVLRVYHIDRGYETIERKLQSLGADIKRVAGEEF
ncbi:MAG TPA: UDP-N-acetylglucosamine 1-carboxyvinyltransferase [Candidatus Kapabacteria bacterium]|nr:UDP-N-acetylglucosamine 1-carboxyvinyltransferase [Candidatus Kapabacteria bacterium]